MKGRETRAPSADLLVCFPTRSHLTLMPKPICSPARSAEPNKRSLHHHHRLKKSSFRGGGGGGGTQGSPMLWSKTKQMGSDISEPTSPKVTCAGQIKVRPKSGSSCKNWQSVMEEIEKLHNTNKKQKKIKKPSWVEAIGFKKDVMQFLNCLRTIRFDFRCFGSFPNADITTSSDDDEDSDSDEDKKEDEENENESTKTVFSKWFMVLQENHNNTKEIEKSDYTEADGSGATVVAPPSNALLLMRCRSAPAKSWLEEKEEEEEEEEEEKKGKMVIEEEINRKKKEENLVVMRYDTDFYKLSSDIAKETWVVGGINKDPLSRSRSWKR